MKKLIVILFCLLINICVYCSVYSPYKGNVEYNKYSTVSSYQYEFKSTSSYTPMVQYQTVKPLNRGGFVSTEYTTTNPYTPLQNSGGLVVDPNEDPTGGLDSPIGNPDIYIIIFLLVSYFVCHYLKIRKSQMLLLYKQKQ